jgi:hypothetical protein
VNTAPAASSLRGDIIAGLSVADLRYWSVDDAVRD